MKKLFKMLSLVCVLALSITAFSLTAFAASATLNDGDVQKATALAEEFLTLETDAERLAKAKELNAYLLANPIGEKYKTAVFALLYGSAECDVCRGSGTPCSDCEGQLGVYARYVHERYELLVDKIMAYAAAYLIENFDESAHNYEQRSVSQWIERFVERGVGGYTLAEIKADDFFAEFSTEARVVKSVAIDDNGKAVYTITILNPAKDETSVTVAEALDAAMISAIESVAVGDSALGADAYAYENGTLTVNDALTVPGVSLADDGESSVPGAAVITVVATVADGYELPAEDSAAASAKTLKELSKEISAKVAAKIQATLDKLSDQAITDYANEKIIFKNAYSDGSKTGLANYTNSTWYGRMYDNGYREEDVKPKNNYGFNGSEFKYYGAELGNYDKLSAGSYVIFGEDVETYYIGSEKSFTEVEVKRNYVYDTSTGEYTKVADGRGLYDYIPTEGFGQLLKPSSYLYFDMTGNTLTSSRPYTHWSGTATGITNVVAQAEFTYIATHSRIYIELYMFAPTSRGGGYLVIENGNVTFNSAGKSADGTSYKGNEYVLKDVVVPGKWTTVTFSINGANIDIYLDYEKVYTTEFYYPDNIESFYGIRAGAHGDGGTGDSSGHGVRNAIVYQGNSPRQLDRFDMMTPSEKFAYFGEIIEEGAVSVPTQIYAYNQMSYSVIDFFTADAGYEGSHIDENGNLVGGTARTEDESVIAALKSFFSFDYEKALAAYKLENAKQYASLVKALTDMPRRYDTIDSRTKAIGAVDKFVAGYSNGDGEIEYIDTDSDEYKTAKAKYDGAVKLLENDEASYEFVKNMEYFKATSLYKKKLMYFEAATEALNAGAIDESITKAGETRLEAAFAIYDGAPEELDSLVYVQNSKYLIMYIEYTMDFDTVESWEKNYSKLTYPLNKAREIIKSGKYYPDYTEGKESEDNYKSLATMLIWYDLINSYFYDKLQEEHIAYITKLQEKYTQSDSYMEKLGICSEIRRYVDSADLDFDNPRLKILLDKNEEYLAEIDELEAPYIEQRDKKTELFVAVMKKLEVAEGYNQIRALLDEAIDYYYTMTVGATAVITDEQITAAINTYNYYIEYEKKIVECSAEFKFIVAQLDGATSYAQYYTILAEANTLLEYVSRDIEGVSAAYDKYELAYNSYTAITAPSNSEIKETQGSVISLRTGYCVSAVLAMFAELIGSIVD